MKTLRRGLVEFYKVGGPFAGIALGCVLVVPIMIFVSVGWPFWAGLLVGFVLAISLLVVYGLGGEEQ